MTIELRMLVRMKEGLTRCAICCWTLSGIGLNRVLRMSMIDRPDGRVQRVCTNSRKQLRPQTDRAIENSRDKNVSSPTNLQLTVHLKRNILVNSNARER